MNRAKDLTRLQDLANVILDHRLSQLQSAARKRAESETAIAGLAAPSVSSDDLEGAMGAIAALNYQRWADSRRAELTQILARQTTDWQQARDTARLAFGKKEALAGLAEKLAHRPKG